MQILCLNSSIILLISFTLLTIAFLGIFVVKRDLITILMSIELIILSIVFMISSHSYLYANANGETVCLIVLTIAAAESSLALSIFVKYFQLTDTINIDLIKSLKG